MRVNALSAAIAVSLHAMHDGRATPSIWADMAVSWFRLAGAWQQ